MAFTHLTYMNITKPSVSRAYAFLHVCKFCLFNCEGAVEYCDVYN